MLSGDYKNAKKYYSKAVDLNPDDPQTYLNKGLNLAWMGVLNNDVGYIEEAYTDMQHALQIDSTQANAYLASFYMKLLLNQPDAALENLYMAKAYMLNNSLLMAKATPYELEEYYLLSKIYSDSLIPYKEKNLAKIYFITFYMYKEKLDVKPILTYLKCTPSSLYINRLLAYHYLSIEDDGKFENALNIVLMLDGTLLHLTSIRAEKMIDKGNVEHGYKLFEILIRNSPDYAYLSYILGSKYLENGDLKNAIFYLDNAIRIAPDYKLAYVDRSLANANKGNYRAALNDALKLLMVEERRSYPWYVAGFACNHLNEPDSAINYLNIALQLSPGFESAYKEKAKSYIKLGDFESAMEVYEIIIDSLDNPAVGYYYSGKLLQDYMESPDKALEAFNKAKDLDSRNSRYHEAIGDVYNYDKGEFQMAIDNYKTAMSFSSENISLYIKTSKAFQQLNDYSSALLYLENALVNDYRNSSVWYQMGYVNYKMKKLETANNCFLKAINYDSNNADAYYAAGSIFWYFSEYNNCLKYSKVAFELDGENCRALLNIALAQLRLGNLEEAERLFKEYLEKIINVEDYDINESIKGVKIFIEENIMADDAKKILKDYFGVDE